MMENAGSGAANHIMKVAPIAEQPRLSSYSAAKGTTAETDLLLPEKCRKRDIVL